MVPPEIVMLLAAPLHPLPIPAPSSPPVVVMVPPVIVIRLVASSDSLPIPAPSPPPVAVRLPSPEMVSVPIFSPSPFF